MRSAFRTVCSWARVRVVNGILIQAHACGLRGVASGRFRVVRLHVKGLAGQGSAKARITGRLPGGIGAFVGYLAHQGLGKGTIAQSVVSTFFGWHSRTHHNKDTGLDKQYFRKEAPKRAAKKKGVLQPR